MSHIPWMALYSKMEVLKYFKVTKWDETLDCNSLMPRHRDSRRGPGCCSACDHTHTHTLLHTNYLYTHTDTHTHRHTHTHTHAHTHSHTHFYTQTLSLFTHTNTHYIHMQVCLTPIFHNPVRNICAADKVQLLKSFAN